MKLKDIKPSDFIMADVFNSVFQKSEYETVCVNALKISKRTGDKWKLSKEDYDHEREKDGGYSNIESSIAEEVLSYFDSPQKLQTFSPGFSNKFIELLET